MRIGGRELKAERMTAGSAPEQHYLLRPAPASGWMPVLRLNLAGDACGPPRFTKPTQRISSRTNVTAPAKGDAQCPTDRAGPSDEDGTRTRRGKASGEARPRR